MLCAQKFRLSKIPGFVHKRLPEIPGFMLGSHRTLLFDAFRSKSRLSKIPGFVLERLPKIPGFVHHLITEYFNSEMPGYRFFRKYPVLCYAHTDSYNWVSQLGNARLYVFWKYPVLCMLTWTRGNTRFCVLRKYPVLCYATWLSALEHLKYPVICTISEIPG